MFEGPFSFVYWCRFLGFRRGDIHGKEFTKIHLTDGSMAVQGGFSFRTMCGLQEPLDAKHMSVYVPGRFNFPRKKREHYHRISGRRPHLCKRCVVSFRKVNC